MRWASDVLGRHHGGGTAMAPRQRWSDFPPDEQGWRTVRPFQQDGLVKDADKHGLGRGTVVAAAAAAVATAVDVDDEDVDVLDAGEMEAKTMAEDSNRSAEMPLAKRSCSGEAKKAEPPQEGQASTSTRAAELAQQAMQDAAKQVQAKLEAGAAAKPGGARAKKSGL